MAEPFLGEIRIFAFTFAPRGWANCDGQLLPINQNQSLYSLLGTTYGGDGRTTFALPELRGRVTIHPGEGHTVGQRSGQENVVLTAGEVPGHGHTWAASTSAGDQPVPNDNVFGAYANGYRSSLSSAVAPVTGTLGNAGSSIGHNNMQPYLTLRFCIALQGLFPSRN